MIIMAKIIHHNLVEITKGMLLNGKIAKDIWNNNRSLVISQLSLNIKVGTLYYLIDDLYCYGVIRFKPPQKIKVKEFNELYDEHLITDTERLQWWPDKEILFSYNFDFVTRFEVPTPIEMAYPLQESSTLIHPFNFCETETRLLDDICKYDVNTYGLPKLQQDLDITLSWLTYKHTGKVHIIHDLKDIKLLVQKLYSQIKSLNANFCLDVARLHPLARDFILKLDKEMPGMLAKDVVSENAGNAGKTANPFILDVQNFTEVIVKHCIKTPFEVVPEYNFNDKILCVERYNSRSNNILLIKYCGTLNLHDLHFKNLSAKYPCICAEAFDLSENNFVMACDVESDVNGSVSCYVTDILYLEGKDVESLDFAAKQSLIHSLNFTNNLKEKMRVLINSGTDFVKATKLIFGLPSSDGVLIKNKNRDVLIYKDE